MDRREAQHARKEGRRVIPLRESDYLLGVFDGHRIGALRFKTNIEALSQRRSPPRHLRAQQRLVV